MEEEPKSWKELYKAAMLELDPDKVLERITKARAAIALFTEAQNTYRSLLSEVVAKRSFFLVAAR